MHTSRLLWRRLQRCRRWYRQQRTRSASCVDIAGRFWLCYGIRIQSDSTVEWQNVADFDTRNSVAGSSLIPANGKKSRKAWVIDEKTSSSWVDKPWVVKALHTQPSTSQPLNHSTMLHHSPFTSWTDWEIYVIVHIMNNGRSTEIESLKSLQILNELSDNDSLTQRTSASARYRLGLVNSYIKNL